MEFPSQTRYRLFSTGAGKMLRRIHFNNWFCFFAALLLLTVPIRWIAAGVFAAVIHELGHYLAVRLLGGEVISTTVSSRGAKMEALPMSQGREILCILAGPAASFSLLLLARFFPRVAICGLIQGVYNLLPIYPLDGGRSLRCLISLTRKGERGHFSCFQRKTPCKDEKQRVQ